MTQIGESGSPLKIVLLHALGVSPFRDKERERRREARLYIERDLSRERAHDRPDAKSASRAKCLVNSKVSSGLKIAKTSAGSVD